MVSTHADSFAMFVNISACKIAAFTLIYIYYGARIGHVDTISLVEVVPMKTCSQAHCMENQNYQRILPESEKHFICVN